MAVSKIDAETCIGCGTCVESCPMDVFRLDTVVEGRREYSPCSLACPLGVRQREYHDLLRMDRMDEAARILGECHPMPAVTGRLCSHPCETDCSRNAIDAPVNINALEEFLGDHLLSIGPPSLPVRDDAARVAVIGSGPAGLAAAYFLARSGHQVTVFEKSATLGGALRDVVPAFRLPEAILDRQIDFYRNMGIGFRSGIRVGRNVTVEGLREEGFRAIVCATGAARSAGLSVPGVDGGGVVSAMDFLSAAKSGEVRSLSGSVVVVGGGSVALDAARTAVRLGAGVVSVVCLECREPGLRDSMPALPEELEESSAEGIVIRPSRGVDSFMVADGRVTGLRCVECLSVRDDDGRFNPAYGECVLPEQIVADTVILAIGQTPDEDLVPRGFPMNQRALIITDATTQHVADDLFAAGDAVDGPSTVVEALAGGKRAALGVERYLRGEGLGDAWECPPRAADPPKGRMPVLGRIERTTVPPQERKRGFGPTVLPYGPREARVESERCLTCGSRSTIAYLDDCQACRLCQKYCPTDSIDVTEGVLLGALHGWDVVALGTKDGGRR